MIEEPVTHQCHQPGCKRVTTRDRALCRDCESALLDRIYNGGPAERRVPKQWE